MAKEIEANGVHHHLTNGKTNGFSKHLNGHKTNGKLTNVCIYFKFYFCFCACFIVQKITEIVFVDTRAGWPETFACVYLLQVVPCFSKVPELEVLNLKFYERYIYFIIFCYIAILRTEGNLGYFNILLITHRHLILWVDKDEIDADQITCYDFKSGVDLNKLQKRICFKLLEVFKNMVYIRPII